MHGQQCRAVFDLIPDRVVAHLPDLAVRVVASSCSGRVRQTLRGVAVVLGTAVVSSCAGPAAARPGSAQAPARAASQAPSELAIGVAPTLAALLPESGGDPAVWGVALAVRDLNASAAPGARRFVVRLPPGSARSGVSVAAAFREDPTVLGVVGPTDSQTALNTIPVYGDVEHGGAAGVVAISPSASSPILSGRSAWLFRVCPDDRAASRAAARYARDSLRVQRAAIVYRNDVYGKGWSQAFAEAFTAAGGTVVMREPEAARMAEWPVPYTEYAKRHRADLLVVAGSGSDAMPLMLAARAAGLELPVLGGDGLSDVRDPATRHVIGRALYTSLFDAQQPSSARARAFVKAFTAAYGAPPGQQAALAYDAAMLLGAAVRQVGADRQAVRAYVASTGRTRPAFIGVTGAIAFDASHDVVDKPVTVARVIDQ